jgi:eukaryotic-like serine/threonine-protein kinase
MSSQSAERNPIEMLAEDFAQRLRAGERPALSEYTRRHPELADEIRELFPALALMENLKPGDHTTGPGLQSQSLDPPLRALGDYRILREIGRGGMGIVYEAEQVSLGRHVALKVLPPQALVNPTYIARFQREAKAAARLHHTNIVPVYGVGQAGGVHFYAMQFIAGEGLDKLLYELRRLRHQQGGAGLFTSAVPTEDGLAQSLLTGRFASEPTPPEQGKGSAEATQPEYHGPAAAPATESSSLTLSGAGSGARYFRGIARIGMQAADALACAHRQGILHRDIKPSNLLLDAQGTVWITDFGLAKAEGADELTHTGDVIGTLRYMAPERFDGRSLPQSDVYGLGITLYELLTLRPAFENKNAARLTEQVLHDPPVAPRRIDAHVPRDLETIVLKCLAKEPTQRYATAEALAEDLRRFLADRPIRARRTSWLERSWRTCRRNPAAAALGASLVLALIGLAVSSTVAAFRYNRQRDNAVRAEHEKTEQLWQAKLNLAKAGRLSRRVGQRFESLRALAEATQIARELNRPEEDFLALRNEALACLALPDLRVAHEWDIASDSRMGHRSDGTERVFDATLEHYVRDDGLSKVSVRRVSDDQEVFQTSVAGVNATYFSPSGRFLHIGSPGSSQFWQLGEKPSKVFEVPYSEWAVFSPDDRWLAFADKEGAIRIVDLTSGQEVRRIATGDHASGLAFHPHKFQITMAGQKSVKIFDLTSGALLGELRQAGGRHITWNPDGKLLAVGGLYESIIHIWDVEEKKETQRLPCQNGGLQFAFDETGHMLVSNGWEYRLRLWDPYTGKLIFSTYSLAATKLSFSADNRLLAGEASGTRRRIWEVAHGEEYRTLAPKSAHSAGVDVHNAEMSPDGRWLAVGDSGGVSFWDAVAGKELGYLTCGLASAHFEPSGALVTNGEAGLLRWPIRDDGTSPGLIQLGPPEDLAIPGSPHAFSMSRDGSVCANAQGWGALVVHRDRPERPVKLTPHQSAIRVSVSPDGRRVATGSFSGPKVKIWDAITGKMEVALPIDTGSMVQFSPNGKWLVATDERLGPVDTIIRLWATDIWQERPSLGQGNRPAFSPDGAILAMSVRGGDIRFVDTTTGQEFARLEDPNQDDCNTLKFSPDGSKLLATNTTSQTVHVWDLRLLRKGLRNLRGCQKTLAKNSPSVARHLRPPMTVPCPIHKEVCHGGRMYAGGIL